MADVINLSTYATEHRAVADAIASAYSPEDGTTSWWSKSESGAAASDFLSAQSLHRMSPKSELGRFFELCTDAISGLEECEHLLAAAENFAADDKFMSLKPLFTELFILRDVSDAVGLLSLTCLQSASKAVAITDARTLPQIMCRAVTRLWSAPFMQFSEAASLSTEIEQAANSLNLPGYAEVSQELIADAQRTDSGE